MNQYYDDIIDKLGSPKWYDRLGYPRYHEFNPNLVSNIYADLVVLMEIGCQNCDEKFLVAHMWGDHDFVNEIETWETIDIWDEKRCIDWHKVAKRFLVERMPHYGDPPAHEDPCGNTENSEPLRIVQCWMRNSDHQWERHVEYER